MALLLNHLAIIARAVLLACCLLASVSCSSNQGKPKHTSSSLYLPWNETVAYFCKLDNKTAALVWFDSRANNYVEGASGNLSGLKHRYNGGTFVVLDGRKIAWHCEIEDKDGKTGRAEIDSKEYDLAGGTLLLVSTRGKDIRVTQLKRDLSGVSPDQAGLERLAIDPDVKGWLSEEAKPKAP